MTTCPDCQKIEMRHIASLALNFQEPGTVPNGNTSLLMNMKLEELREKGYIHDSETMSMVLQCSLCKLADEETREDGEGMGSEPG